MRHIGHYTNPHRLTRKDIIEMLMGKIDKLEIESAKKEVAVFISNLRSLDIWSKDFFKSATKRIVGI